MEKKKYIVGIDEGTTGTKTVVFDTEGHAAGNAVSIEMAARDLRYGWFAELCNKHGFAGVMTAHNANDNAETLMLNLLRGAGLNGLHGMQEVQGRWMFEIPKTPVCASHIHPLAGGGMSSPSFVTNAFKFKLCLQYLLK